MESDYSLHSYRIGLIYYLNICSHKNGFYQLGFNTKPGSLFWYRKRLIYEKQEFEKLLNSLCNGNTGEFPSRSSMSLWVHSAPLGSEAMVSVGVKYKKYAYHISRRAINSLSSDFKSKKI